MDEFLLKLIEVFLKTPKADEDKVANGYLFIQAEYGGHLANCALALHKQIWNPDRKVVD